MAAAITSYPHPETLRVLIVRVGAMGDVLHALPAVTALRARLPHACLGWAIEPRWQPLLESAHPAPGEAGPLVDHIHPVPVRDWKQSPFSIATLRQIAALRRAMHAERYDLCVDLQGSIRSAAIGRLSGAPRLIGSRRPRERQARALYGERVTTSSRHVIDQACELLSAALPDAPPLLPAAVSLPGDAVAERWCDDLLAGDAEFSQRMVLLLPTAGWGAKQWPVPHFAALARRLTDAGCLVLVNVSSTEDAVGYSVAQPGYARPVLSRLPELIALTRRAALVIGGDTGPLHLAAALGRPVIALFGPTDPARNGPAFPGADAWVLRHRSSLLSHKRFDRTEPGLARISVDKVYEAAQSQMRGEADRKAAQKAAKETAHE